MAHVADHLSVNELQERWRSESDATAVRHYQTIWHLAQGRTIVQTAKLTSFASRWIEQLLARYNSFGPSALGDRRIHNGSKPTLLTPDLLARLKVRLESDPDDGGVWTSKKVAAFMAIELGLAEVAVQRGWEALKAVGYSIQKPRPRHAGAATPEEEDVFKKNSPRPSPRSKPPIRKR